jgi:hypothetical protein
MTGTKSTELARFRELIDTHGPSPDRWPPNQRDWAEQLASSDPEATSILTEAEDLDAQLDLVTAPSPSAALVGEILNAANTGSGWRLPGWLFPMWKPAGAMAVALLLGLAVGGMTPPDLTGSTPVAEEIDLLYGDDAVADLGNGGSQ